jgi:hypothetical protein
MSPPCFGTWCSRIKWSRKVLPVSAPTRRWSWHVSLQIWVKMTSGETACFRSSKTAFAFVLTNRMNPSRRSLHDGPPHSTRSCKQCRPTPCLTGSNSQCAEHKSVGTRSAGATDVRLGRVLCATGWSGGSEGVSKSAECALNGDSEFTNKAVQ